MNGFGSFLVPRVVAGDSGSKGRDLLVQTGMPDATRRERGRIRPALQLRD